MSDSLFVTSRVVALAAIVNDGPSPDWVVQNKRLEDAEVEHKESQHQTSGTDLEQLDLELKEQGSPTTNSLAEVNELKVLEMGAPELRTLHASRRVTAELAIPARIVVQVFKHPS